MAEGHKDYSGTPLWKKLGIRQGSRVVLVGAPPGFDDLLAGRRRCLPRWTSSLAPRRASTWPCCSRPSAACSRAGSARSQRALDPDRPALGRRGRRRPRGVRDRPHVHARAGTRPGRGPRRQQDGLDHRRLPGLPVRDATARSSDGSRRVGEGPVRAASPCASPAAGTLGRCRGLTRRLNRPCGGRARRGRDRRGDPVRRDRRPAGARLRRGLLREGRMRAGHRGIRRRSASSIPATSGTGSRTSGTWARGCTHRSASSRSGSASRCSA